MMRRLGPWATLVLCAAFPACAQEKPAPHPAAPGHWPQWRGPDRNNCSPEKGVLREWPEGGPALLWKVSDLGTGVGNIAVAGGMIFLMGYKADAEYLTALDGVGKVVWSRRIGPLAGEQSIMRWLSQRTPVVDDDRVYAFTADGVLSCHSSANGEVRWTKNYVNDLHGMRAAWGFCDFPLVDKDFLICTPGGSKNTVVALDKKTGALRWSCPVPKCNAGSHSALFLTELAGVRQYVHQLDAGTVGIAQKDGALLWTYGLPYQMGNVHCAVPFDDNKLFTLSGWGIGGALIKIERKGDSFAVVEQYSSKFQFDPWIGGTIKVGGRLFSCQSGGLCIDLDSGVVVYRLPIPDGRATGTWADGRFYIRTGKNQTLLMEEEDSNLKIVGRLRMPVGKEPAWSFPVVVGGRLYLRDQGDLSCFDVRAPGYLEPAPVWSILPKAPSTPPPPNPGPPPKPKTDAVFVPTPQDVVERMLEVAQVTRDDVVYDLGSGDGRIVLTASKSYGCKAVGIENDPELVRQSRLRIQKESLPLLAKVEEADLFTSDFSSASVVTLYLGAPNNERLLPRLRALKPGSRIVSHAHLLGEKGPRPDATVRMTSKEDGVEHEIHLWRLPLKEIAPEEKRR